MGDRVGERGKARQRRLHETLGILPAEHVGGALHRAVDEDEARRESRARAHKLEGDGRAPRMTDHDWAIETEVGDHRGGVVEQLVHGISPTRAGFTGRSSGQTVAALIKRDDAVTGQLAGETVPVARVGAEPV